jgi:hypothetical protein
MKNIDEYTKGNIRIPKKAMIGIAPAIAITGVLLSKGNIGALVVLISGISCGVLVGRGFFEGNKQKATPEE